jgi:hypothetical protein
LTPVKAPAAAGAIVRPMTPHQPIPVFAAALAAAALFSGAAAAQDGGPGLQYIVGFESPGDLAGVGFDVGLDTRFACHGCSIRQAIDPAYPAHGGTHQAWGDNFDIVVQDPFNISWPAMGAYVTGSDVVYADFYEYDPDLGDNRLFATLQTDSANFEGSGGTPNVFLQLGFGEPRFLTLAHFYSSTPFSIDDVTIGRADVGPGIPEPGAWALMTLGFAGVGAALRSIRPTCPRRAARRA